MWSFLKDLSFCSHQFLLETFNNKEIDSFVWLFLLWDFFELSQYNNLIHLYDNIMSTIHRMPSMFVQCIIFAIYFLFEFCNGHALYGLEFYNCWNILGTFILSAIKIWVHRWDDRCFIKWFSIIIVQINPLRIIYILLYR